MMEIYMPREDSFLLERLVRKHATGNVIDVCTGSGYLAYVAARKNHTRKVLGVDINKKAISFAKKRNSHNKITFKVSNLFPKTEELYDTIICNPPYLPEDDFPNDIALIGGKQGYEFTLKFLEEASKRLTLHGHILLLISSKTKPAVVIEFLNSMMLIVTEEMTSKFNFETLYALRIQKTPLRKNLERRGVGYLHFAAKGKRGFVYKGWIGKNAVAIKIKNPASKSSGRIVNEIKILKKVNKMGYKPWLLSYTKDFFIREWAHGDFLLDFVEKNNKSRIKKILKELLKLCYDLDNNNIQKEEMHRPWKHVIIEKNVALIDFERAKIKKTHKNVTQFLQMLRSIQSELKKKGFNYDYRKMISIGKTYSKKHDIKPIIDLIKNS